MFERTSQSPSVNDDLVKNNNSTSDTDNYAMTSLRQHRLTPPSFTRTNTLNTASNVNFKTKPQNGDKAGSKHAKAKAVKMWIMKGVVQVSYIKSNILHHNKSNSLLCVIGVCMHDCEDIQVSAITMTTNKGPVDSNPH